MKFCTGCSESKDESEFWVQSKATGKLNSRCKVCMRKANKNWQTKNPDKLRAHVKKYAATEAGKRSAREAEARYRLANPHVPRTIDVRRKASKIQATPKWANQEKIAEFYFTADFLGMVTGE